MSSWNRWAVFGAVVLACALVTQSALAQIGDPECVDKANNFARKVSAKQNKANRKCVKNYGKGKLVGTPDACVAAADDTVAKMQVKTQALFIAGGVCDGDGGSDLVTNAATINDAHIMKSIDLLHDVFGSSLDVAGVLDQTKPGNKCQDKLTQRSGQLFDAWTKEFRSCKKASMKDGAATAQDVIGDCLSATAVAGVGSRLADAKGKVAKKGQKLGDDVQKACLGEALAAAAVAPGACAAGGPQGDFIDCLQDLAECRACQAVRDADNLTVNCDLVDNNAVDGSCPGLNNNTSQCEVLNGTECLLPFPSSRFLVTDGSKATGLRVEIPELGLPSVNGPAVSSAPFNELDGFSSMAQILMHFPQGLDLQLSDTARLLEPECCGQVAGPPWIDTRAYTSRSLDLDSPTVLMKASTGERILHWMEIDARAAGGQIPARQTVFLRPGVSLEPGERYIVAMRNLKTPAGVDIEPEVAFRALRDNIITSVNAIEIRRAQMEADVFTPLTNNGIARNQLDLAFDFTTQSDQQQTGQLVSMRDQAFAWLDTVEAAPGMVTFTVSSETIIDTDCSPNTGDPDCCTEPDDVVWKQVHGTFQTPLFLTGPPVQSGVQFMNVDGNDVPVQNGFMNAPYDVTIPCSVFNGGVTSRPIVLGHGIFGTGLSMVQGIPNLKAQFADWTYIGGGTDWLGLSSRRDDPSDFNWVAFNIIGVGNSQLNNFPAFIDRLKQGMVNQLVLGSMMKRGLFNRDTAFEKSVGVGVFPGPAEEMYYYGISLGGIHGTLFAALSPDVVRHVLDVPAANFGCLLQRSTQFDTFELAIQSIGIGDPMEFALLINHLSDIWVSADPAGFLRHITSNPLPGSGVAKKMYYMPAWLDKQVSNQCTEPAARTMGLVNLPGSIQQGLPGITDATGPVDNGMVVYDTGAFDILNPLHVPEFPPLANRIPTNTCDPHGGPRAIPAATRSMINFLQPGGQIANLCNGLCDAAEPLEIQGGGTCDGSSPVLLQGALCAEDVDCGGGTCVAIAACGECDAASPPADQGKPCGSSGPCNGGTCVIPTVP